MNFLYKFFRTLISLIVEIPKGIYRAIKGVAETSILAIMFVVVAFLILFGPMILLFSGVITLGFIGNISDSVLGFWSAYILLIGMVILIWNYRLRVSMHKSYFTGWFGLKAFSSDEYSDAKFARYGKDFDRERRLREIETAFSESRINDNLGYLSLSAGFILWTVELSIDIVPTFYTTNLIGIFLAASVYFLIYSPRKISEEKKLENYDVPKFYFPKNESIGIMVFLVLAASFLAGYIEYARL